MALDHANVLTGQVSFSFSQVLGDEFSHFFLGNLKSRKFLVSLFIRLLIQGIQFQLACMQNTVHLLQTQANLKKQNKTKQKDIINYTFLTLYII